MNDPYEVLGVPRTASQADIRRAYRRLALANHPDKNSGDAAAEVRFVRINQAYELLSNSSSRSQFDRTGAVPAGYHTSGNSEAHVDRTDAEAQQHWARAQARAREQFKSHFGEQLAQQWQPGMRVSGVLERGGKRITVIINPDGTTEETEEAGLLHWVLQPLSLLGINVGSSSTSSAAPGGAPPRQSKGVSLELSCSLM